jgi:hypothetical protein
MKIPNFANLCAAALCLALTAPAFAQTASSEPASRDDVILYLRTMHSHDLMQKMMEAQSQSMQQMFRDQLGKDKGLPPDFEAHFKKVMADLVKGMPVDEMTQAMIPAYQKHFTKGDIEAMNTFYSSPVGQKVLQELPVVTQEGMQEMMPILNKYIGEWKDRMQQEFQDTRKPPSKDQATAPAQN